MRHLNGTYEPDRPKPSRVRFALAVAAWGLLGGIGIAAAFVGPELVVAALDPPGGRR